MKDSNDSSITSCKNNYIIYNDKNNYIIYNAYLNNNVFAVLRILNNERDIDRGVHVVTY